MEASISNEVITKQNEVYHTYETIRTSIVFSYLFNKLYNYASKYICLYYYYYILLLLLYIKIIMIFIRSYYILPSKVRTNERTNKVISSNNKIIHQEFIYYLRKLTFEGIYVLNSRKSLFPGVSAYP